MARILKPFLIPDYYDGTKNILFDMYPHSARFGKIVGRVAKTIELEERIDKNGDVTFRSYFSFEKERMEYREDEEIIGNIFEALSCDEMFSEFTTNLGLYYKYGSKNYVFSTGIIKAFGKTKLNISKNHLPDNFCAYFEMSGVIDPIQGSLPIKGSFVCVKYAKGIPWVRIVNVLDVKKNSFSHFIFRFSKETISDSFGEDAPHSWAEIILNGILYVTSELPDIMLERNEFDTKPSKREAQQAQFTPKNWIFVGKNFDYVTQKNSPAEHDVSGHWRWQACGPNWSQHRYTYIAPFLRGGRGADTCLTLKQDGEVATATTPLVA